MYHCVIIYVILASLLCEIEMSSEQPINLKFLVRLGKTRTEALNLLNLFYGDNTMSRACVFKWHKNLRREGRRWRMIPEVEGLQLAEMMKTLKETMRQKVRGDRRLTVGMIANELGISCERV